MGALTLTSLLPTIYNAMDVVSRELVGFIPAVSRDANATRAAVGETIMSPVVGAMAAENLNVGAYPADTPAQTIGNVSMTISKARSVPFGVTGEEALGLTNAGTLDTINRDRITQCLRTLTNEVEADLAGLYTGASRAYGTATGTPFATAGDLSDFAAVMQMLDDNGAPASDRHLVLGSASISRIRGKQSVLFKVNESGTDAMLRQGIIGSVEGLAVHNSAQVKTLVTVGSSNNAGTTDTTGYAVGTTSITMASAGTGSIIAGDIVTFTGDTNEYVVVSGPASLASGGTLVLAEPGLKKALAASAVTTTVVAATTRCMGFHRSAIQLITRAPAMPPGGDMADDVMVVTDPVSGIAYEFAIYKQKRQVRYEVNLAWGVKAVATRHIVSLIGA